MRGRKNYLISFVCAMLFSVSSPRLVAQNTASISGTLKDTSGAIFPGAAVTLVSSQNAQPVTATANAQGGFEFRRLAPGSYTVTVDVTGFVHYEQGIEVSAGQPQRLNITLTIATVQEQVDVDTDAAQVGVSAQNSASSISLNATDLDAFSDDPDELETQLRALAGPAAGPNGGQLYVDGFTAESGTLPPKNSILAIRVNQDPFSSQYDRLGYGRVEILTKPGASVYHGRFQASGNDLAFDTKDPFAVSEPGYYSLLTSADLSGPLGKKGSFFYTYQHRNIDNNGIITAYKLDSNNNPVPDNATLGMPSHLDVTGPRFDFQLSKNNVYSFTYQWSKQIQNNLGVGQFYKADQAYALESLMNQFRMRDTQVVGSRFVNEINFQMQDQAYTDTPASMLPERDVLGGFIDGGNSLSYLNEHHHHTETNYLATLSLRNHTVSFGGRLRTVQEPYVSPGDFNGTFTFTSLNTFATKTPSQYHLTIGDPVTKLYSDDLGVFITDDWRARHNVLVSFGVRFENQNYLHDQADFAPRASVAWGVGKGKSTPKTVLRFGYGVFFDRFSQQMQLQEMELNGVKQTEYLLRFGTDGPGLAAATSFYTKYYPQSPGGQYLTPKASDLLSLGAVTTFYQPNNKLHAPYTLQAALGAERQISKFITASATWLNSRGGDQFITTNINAPRADGTRPTPTAGNIYQYQSAAIFRQNQLITNATVRFRRISLFGSYTLTYANSDSAGPGSFPDDQYNIAGDYGRASFDIRHRAVTGGSVPFKYGITFSPLMNVQSGAPYNFTLGQDLRGSTVFNQRPSYATPGATGPNIVKTAFGTFNTNPAYTDARIPINLGQGPAAFVFNLRASKSFGFGKRGGSGPGGGGGGSAGMGGSGGSPNTRPGTNNQAGAGGNLGGRGLGGAAGGGGGSSANRRFGLTVSAEARNLFNNVNLGPPVGIVTSPLLGKSNRLEGGVYSFSGTNRRIDLQVGLSF